MSQNTRKRRKKRKISAYESRLQRIRKAQKRIPDLQVADLVLVRTKGNFLRYLLRRATNSHWDHVALVIFPRNYKKGYMNNLIVETRDERGISIHKMEKYVNFPEKYDIGIKRVPGLKHDVRKRIISYMLMNVDAPYYRLKHRRFLLAIVSKKYSEKLFGRQRYCCSGFVQKAFYDAADWSSREKYVFREDYLSPIELQDITTPGDIAKSNNAKWIYNPH
ncbi:hypothetical protein ACFL2D_00265 [Patescibacteria group bacterium]